MSFAVSIPQNLKYKRFNKRFSKISSVCESRFNQVICSSSYVCGLKCLEGGFLSVQKIHQYVLLLRRSIGKGRVGWSRLRLFMNVKIPKTAKSAGHRMGKGKGALRYWGMSIKSGSFIFKIKNSPFKYSYIDSLSWSLIYAVEEFVETYSFVVFKHNNIIQANKKSGKSVLHFILRNPRVSFYILGLLHTMKSVFDLKLRFLNRFMMSFLKFTVYGLTSCYKKVMRLPLKIARFNNSYFSLFFFLNSTYKLKKGQRRIKKYIGNKARVHISKIKKMAFMNKKVRVWLLKKFLNYFWIIFINFTEDAELKCNSNILELETGFIETKAYIEKFQNYPDFRISYMPSLFRGLSRVKKKLPFRSEVVFFGNKTTAFQDIKLKRQKLKHTSQK